MTNSGSTKNFIPWILVALLAMVLIWLIVERKRLSEENIAFRAELQEVSTDKDKVKEELNQLLKEYEQMESSNADINLELNKEREKIKKMISQIRFLKSSNTEEIEKYKRQIKTMRSVMQSFVRQIDSLNTKNQELTAEVSMTNKKYQQTLGQKNELQSRSDSLNNQVRMAEVLIADNVEITILNNRGSVTTRASKAKKLQVDFVLRDNLVAKKGNRNVYLIVYQRIEQGVERILANDIQSGTSNFYNKNNQLENSGFSSTIALLYEGNKTTGTLFFDFPTVCTTGEYTVEIFVDSKLAGQKVFILK